jgi:hypothetical protein
MKKIVAAIAACLVAIPLGSAVAQVPSGDTGFGDARAHNLPTSRAVSGGHWYGRSGYVHRHWRWHHRNRHW